MTLNDIFVLKSYLQDLLLLSFKRQSVEEASSCSISSKCSFDKPQQNFWGKSLNILSPGDILKFRNCISSRFTTILCRSTTFISCVTNVTYLQVATCAYSILDYFQVLFKRIKHKLKVLASVILLEYLINQYSLVNALTFQKCRGTMFTNRHS